MPSAAFNPDLIAIFVLAAFLGLQLIKRVSTLLHSPLMSLTNAIAAVAVVGAIIILGEKDSGPLAKTLGFIAVTAATVNLVSGFLITDRMLKMFKKGPAKESGAKS
jgi:NAD(P) transhydrogenase subunit alpha